MYCITVCTFRVWQEWHSARKMAKTQKRLNRNATKSSPKQQITFVFFFHGHDIFRHQAHSLPSNMHANTRWECYQSRRTWSLPSFLKDEEDGKRFVYKELIANFFFQNEPNFDNTETVRNYDYSYLNSRRELPMQTVEKDRETSDKERQPAYGHFEATGTV